MRVTVVCVVLALVTQTGQAAMYEWDGVSAKDVAVSFEAEMTISGDQLTVVLRNTSASPSQNPDDLLTGFYFDVFNGTTRPTLTYVSGSGNVYRGDKAAADTLVATNANLKAQVANDDTWQFKTFTPADPLNMGFGIGTAGYNNMGPYGYSFNGNIVDGVNYGIYAGDVNTKNLDGLLLVKDEATFIFSGMNGFTYADLGSVVFGLGTKPDSYAIVVPLPAAVLLGMLGFGVAGLKLRKYV